MHSMRPPALAQSDALQGRAEQDVRKREVDSPRRFGSYAISTWPSACSIPSSAEAWPLTAEVWAGLVGAFVELEVVVPRLTRAM